MIYIGPHVSIAKDIAFAPQRAKGFKANAFALFLKNQKIWSAPDIKDESADCFKENLNALGFNKEMILPHAGYLINMASPSEEARRKSLTLLKDEIRRARKLGLDKLNIHPGAYIEGERRDGLKRSAAMLDEALEGIEGFTIAIENTAGSGSNLGSDLNELSEIIELAKEKDKLGVTLDTCHLYGAGYDVKNEASMILDQAVGIFGYEKLIGMHLNDSKAEMGTRKDRHDSLGKGKIGLDAFKEIVCHKASWDRPLILETIDESLWEYEVTALLEFYKEHIGQDPAGIPESII